VLKDTIKCIEVAALLKTGSHRACSGHRKYHQLVLWLSAPGHQLYLRCGRFSNEQSMGASRLHHILQICIQHDQKNH